MMTINRQNMIWQVVGMYLLAILFLFKAINCFVNPVSVNSGSALGTDFYLTMLAGCAWSIAALSFMTDIWTRITGLVVVGVSIAYIVTAQAPLLIDVDTFSVALLPTASYCAIIGGAIIIASRNMEKQEHVLVSHSILSGLVIGGRFLVGLFYFIVGYLHMANVGSDAQMIPNFPHADLIVIFVGLCWFATALSLWSNILTSLSSILAVLMVLIITFTVTINKFHAGITLGALLAVASNVGIIGVTLIAGSDSNYPLFRRRKR